MDWRYTIRLPNGMRETDNIAAPTIELARQRLEARGGEILEVKKAPKEFYISDLIPGATGVTTRDVVIFSRQFSTMIDAGLPLVMCIDILGSQAENPMFGRVLKRIKARVEEGASLSEAMAEHPAIFDKLYSSLVLAGETGGVLDVVMQRLAEYMEKADSLKSKIKSAMMYPAITVVVAVGAVVLMMTMVLPAFKSMFSDFGGTLPLLTRKVMALSDWMVANLLTLFLGGVAIWIVWALIRRSKKGHYITDKIFLYLPVFGSLIRKTAVAGFTRTLGTMLQSGVSIIDALDICSESASNDVVAEAIEATRTQISEGRAMVEPLLDSGVFPPMVCSMIAVGEQSGALDVMLTKIADFYDDEVDSAVDGLTSMIEPFLMVFLGGTIGTLVIAMYLPIFDIINQVG
jgi:type IV pilus assembly protein PilC